MRKGLLATLGVLVAFAMLAVGCAQTDAGLTTSVKTKLATDDTVKAYKIDVDTKDGVVTLNGTVESDAARQQAVQLARSTEGVRDVVDNLRIETEAAPTTGTSPYPAKEPSPAPTEYPGEAALTDTAITAGVKAKLLVAENVGGLRINVDTNQGVVTLTGRVNSHAEKQEAIRLARGVEGVKQVVDRLTINRE